MKYKCHECIFKEEWKENGKIIPICIRNPGSNFEEAVEECSKPGACPHHTTLKEARLYMETNNDN